MDPEKKLDAKTDVLSPSPVSEKLSSSATASDLDDNYDLYKRQDGAGYDAAEAKRVLRKIDLRIVPVLFTIYLLQYLDKNGINYAAVYGLEKGTHLTGQDYSWLSSVCLMDGSSLHYRFLSQSSS